jgi:conjugal transfer pilus assembly protein TraU
MRKLFLVSLLTITCLIFYPLAVFATSCSGSWVNPITDVCWSCLFPISIGSAGVIKGAVPDTENPKLPVCACGSPIPRIGLSIGFWEPTVLVDVTRHPFCLVNLGGLSLSMGSSFNTGSVETAQNNDTHSFYYVHWYVYPLLNWLNLIDDIACAQKGDLDIAYLTELDPTWRDDELHFLTDPEAILFGNPIAQAACAVDSAKSTFSLPIDALFWCAGAQGSMYPLTGWVQEHVSGVQASLLLAERLAFKMHRLGLAWDSVGEDGLALCSTYPSPILPKSRYRYQMVNPLPTTGQTGCHPFGAGTFTWEAFHQYPYKGEDFGYLIWRKRNCCFL